MARGSYFSGDEYLDSLYVGYGTDPTTDKGLQDNLVKLLDVRAKLYAGLNKAEIDRELRTLSEQAKLYKTARETSARVAETSAKSSRVTAQNVADVKIALDNNDRALAVKLNAVSPAWGTAESAARAGEVAGKPNVLAAASELAKWQDAQGKVLGEDSAEVAPTMNRLATMMFGKNITEVTPEQMVAALGTSAPQSIKDFVYSRATAAKRRYGDMLTEQGQIQKDKSELDRIRAEVAAGSGGAEAIRARLNALASNLEPQLMRALGRSAADIEAQRELTVNRNAELTKLDDDIDIARQRAYGTTKATADEKIGRLMATPQFKAWAEGNGYKIGDYNVDENGKLSMFPGQDDKAALRVFLYQAKRTDQKYGPLFADKSTGVLVRVTAQDPAQRAQVMAKYKSTDGSYYLDAESNELVKPSQAREELERGGFIPSVEASRAGYFRLPDGTVLDMEGKPATAPANAVFVPAYMNDESGKPKRYLTMGDVSSPEKVLALTETPAQGAPDKMGLVEAPEEKAALDAVAKGAPYTKADEATVQSSWTGVYTGYLDRPHARDALAGKTGMSAISLDGGKIRISGDRPATIEVVKARDPGIVAGVVRAYNKLMPEQHLEKLRTEGVAVDREDGMPLAERVQLGEEQFARFTAEPPPAPRAPTDAVMTTTAPSGQVLDVTLPIRSGAVETAMREQRDLIPVGGDTQTPAAAPASIAAPGVDKSGDTGMAVRGVDKSGDTGMARTAAPAAKPAPTTATSAAKTVRVKDDEGNVFDVSNEKITLVSQPAGARVSTKKEWTQKDPAFENVMKGLEKTGQLVEPEAAAPKAETKPAPSALPVAKKTTDVKAPAETGPKIGSRQAAAVVVPRKVTPTTDEQDVERYAAGRAAEQAKAEKAKPETPYVPKPTEEGQRFREQDEALPISGAQKAADESFLRKVAARTGRPELVSRMEGLRVMQGKNPLLYEQMLRETGGPSIEQMAAEERRKLRPKSGEPLKTVDAFAAGTTGYQPERMVSGVKPGTLKIAPPGSETVTAEAEFETPTPAPTPVAQPKLSLWKRLTGKNTNQPSGAQE